MRLKSLELHGFKSFPDRTKVNFSEGMTVIVGPNGSGKSNISDAIRWVLGELSSKNIRGNKMEDVIFGGTNSRSPMSFAEVSLTIENSGDNRISSDYDEIKITRRYYRSGDSEYLINNKVSRLKDITEMFLNTGIGKTGYSIVGQGRVSEIISQKSEERRIIFEEAAGISKYRIKKQEAERRLAETDGNLVRLHDILGELSARVGPLEKESAKARIYLDLYEKKKLVDVSLAVFDLDKISSSAHSLEQDYLTSKQELELTDDMISSLDNRIDRLSDISNENKMEYERSSREITELTAQKHNIESDLLVAKNDIEHSNSSKKMLEATLALSQNSKIEKNNLLISTREKFKNTQSELELLQTKYNTLQEMIDNVRQKLVDCENTLEVQNSQKAEILRQYTEARIALSAIDESKSSIDARRSEIQEQIDEFERKISITRNKISSVEETLSTYKEKLDALLKQKEQIAASNEERSLEINELQTKYNAMLADISSKEQRALTLKRMEEHFEGYSRSVKFIAEASEHKRLDGICGPVSHLITVDRKYSVAIETALGANLQNIVVEDETAAKAAIALLKRENMGRSTFYPITSMRPSKFNISQNVLSSRGYIGVATELISYDEKYNNVISSLLGKTLIFDTLDNASYAAKVSGYSVKIVTLDGQVINAGGSFTGGSSKKDSSILTRSVEIEEILSMKEKSTKEAANIKEKLDSIKNVVSEENEVLNRISEDYSLFSALYKSEHTALDMHKNALSEQISGRDAQVKAYSDLDAREHEKECQRENLKERCNSFSNTISDFDKAINDNLDIKNSVSVELNRLISEKNDAMISVSVKNKEVEVAKERMLDIQAEYENVQNDEIRINDQLQELADKKKFLESVVIDLTAKLDSVVNNLSAAQSNGESLTEKSLEIDKEINELRTASRDKSRERETIFTRYTTLSAKVESIALEKSKLTEKLWEDYELTIADAKLLDFEQVTDETRSKKVSEQNKLRSKIRELGSVNVSAIEEYRTVKERFEFNSKQIEDLEKGRKQCTDIISETEKEMCSRFTTTFEKINENFKKVFVQLFGGGTASLTLTDPENVLTSGIDINVAPPGKIIKNLKLLSGGEQVFVAIAIYFAILGVNPSPFCLLDEIESALDEVNVDRFANYVKNFTDKTQFIIITHRRGTMEEADSLYGVTMQERGISKILSINVNEVEQKLGVKV